MQLTVKEVAELLNTNEDGIYRWIADRGLPAHEVDGQHRFHRAEVLEWATSNGVRFSPRLFQSGEDLREAAALELPEALERGGVFYDVPGASKDEVLRNMVERLPLPEEIDREFLLQILLAREALESTGIGEGIALPHVRNPIVLHVQQPLVTLCFLANPVEFGAVDGQPVYALFSLISPAVQLHLHLLSRLAHTLRDPGFKALLQARGKAEDLLDAARRVSAALPKPSGGKVS
ncbi:MAG: PTS sugar transporter subunit IIA [Verrucomicrobiae bacterium]|nr:PTS sugar transporter subunit IIA [Verrucomicrobiae bacterium]